jgi:LuxR family maltose regulon positive regulatory protein
MTVQRLQGRVVQRGSMVGDLDGVHGPPRRCKTSRPARAWSPMALRSACLGRRDALTGTGVPARTARSAMQRLTSGDAAPPIAATRLPKLVEDPLTDPARAAAGLADNLLLKVTAPRVPPHLIARPRLLSTSEPLRACPVILVQAPAGFGKTSLLAQWRKEHLALGAVVAWMSAQARDDVQRLVQSLALAVRVGSGRPTFGHTLLDATPPDDFEGITIWLAELAHMAMNVVLFVDEADRLPQGSRDALAYALRNAPPNLRVVVAARTDGHLGIDDLIDYGQCVVVGPAMLRFQLEETIELVRNRFGERVDADTAARLHELTEAWPLGLQLALSVAATGRDPRGEISAMAAHGSELRDHLVSGLISNFASTDVDFLVRIAPLDALHPDLCRAVTASDEAADRLARMSRDTPLFVAAEQGEWLRMHALVREVLRRRFAALASDEQVLLHERAAAWLADHGLLEAAARHALACGQTGRAYDLAERSLYESCMTRGRPGTVLEWLAHLSEDELDRRPRMRLAAAWSLALSERHEEAGSLVARILEQASGDDSLRCECALILGGAAVFADQPDRFAELHDPWADAPPLSDPLLLHVHANRSAYRALIEGQPALARLRQQQAPRGDFQDALAYVGRWGELIVGLTYLWEGQVLLAENLLQPTLASAEADLGRRSPFASMLAALLAAAVFERDRPAEATAMLANRLDVLERYGIPEALLIAYRTLARAAVAEGGEHRAMELLGALHAVGVSRSLPRMRLASLAEQVRIHARRYRAETCRALCEQIDALLAEPQVPRTRLWLRSVGVQQDLARGHAAIAAQDWRRALDPLARAGALAQELQLRRLHIEILGLRALALDRCGERAQLLLREAVDLARTYGLLRVFADAHPDLDAWVRQAVQGPEASTLAPASAARAAEAPSEPVKLRATPGTALTPKEREVVLLLARNLSNKEIGLAMQVGEETIKWHVKNLFAKLDAGTRKQVVQRARLLGLIDAG